MSECEEQFLAAMAEFDVSQLPFYVVEQPAFVRKPESERVPHTKKKKERHAREQKSKEDRAEECDCLASDEPCDPGDIAVLEQRLAEQESDRPVLTAVWKKKYEREAKTYWDKFYKRNETNFFKDRLLLLVAAVRVTRLFRYLSVYGARD